MSVPNPPAAPQQPPASVPPAGAQAQYPNVPSPYPGATPSDPNSYAPAPHAAAQGLAPKKTNVVALVALIIAAIGFIFACIPGALLVGWILLPIAFVLSIVSLFLKGDRKWMGVVGLILSIIGTIVGFIVFFATLVTAVDDAFGDTETTVTQPADETETDDVVASDAEEPTDAAAQGARENPYVLGSQISSSDWTVLVNSHTADGAAAVAEGNMFNEPAPAGSHYEIVNYTVTYTGAESGLASEVSLDVVTSAGNVVNTYDSFVSLSDGFGFDELYNGAAATGSVAFLVPDDETVLIRVTPGFFTDEVFVQP